MSGPDEGNEVYEDEDDVTATVPDVPGALRARDSQTGEEIADAEEDAEESSGDDHDGASEPPAEGAEGGSEDDEDEDAQDEGDADEDEGDADEDEGDADEDEGDADEDDDADDDDRGPIEVRYYGATDVGLVREHNEDNFVCVDLDDEVRGVPDDAIRETEVGSRGLVLAVCDGMGGAAAGEVASQMAVDTVDEVMKSGDTEGDHDLFAHRLVYSIEEAGSRIFGAAKMDRSRRGMGTTSTVAGLMDQTLFVGQVGDSRCYVLRNGKLKLITKDQSLVNQLIEAGQLSEEEAEEFEHSNIILQALGTTEEVSVDLTFLELRRGDRIMLCSDGLSGLVHAELIQEVMAEGDDLKAMTHKLIEMANAGGGHDNITCVMAEFGGEGLAPAEEAPEPNYMPYPLPPLDGRSGSIPAREPTMKTSARKPGSDVKRPPIATRADDPTVPSQGGKLGPAIVILVLIAIVAAVVYSMREDEPTEEPTVQTDPEPTEPTVAEPSPVDVRISSDVVGGELFIDEQNYGPLESGVPLHLELLPGAYRFEARQDGSVLASATVTIREDVPADVALMLPGGAADTSPDAGIEEEEPEPPPTMEPATMAATMATTMRSTMGPTMRSTTTQMSTETTSTEMTTEMAATMEPAGTMDTSMESTMESTMVPTNPF
jgi:serine/threonine protein phosphatase PrpC